MRETDQLDPRGADRPQEPEWWGELPVGVDDDEGLVISFERAALDVATGRGGVERTEDYGILRGIIQRRLRDQRQRAEGR